jgi:hypothetical protein
LVLDNQEPLGNAIGATSTGLKLSAKLLQNFAGAARHAENVSNFLSKIAPALSFVSDLIQLHEDIGNLRDDPNVGEAIAAFGTILGLAGDVVAPIAPRSTALKTTWTSPTRRRGWPSAPRRSSASRARRCSTYLEQHQGTPSIDIFGPPSYDQY